MKSNIAEVGFRMYKLKDLTDMKKNETTGSATLKGATGNGVKTPNNGQTVKDFVMGMLVVVRMEIEVRKKSLNVTDAQLAEMVLARIEEDNRTFSDEKEERMYYGAVTREVVWNYANATEAEHIINRLKSGDQLFAQKFFYGTNNSGCNISRFRSKICAHIKQAYHYEVSVEEFGNIVYTHLWDNGTWSVLDNYAKKSSFFCWLEQVSRHEVMRELEDMKIINMSRERTSGNTRLLGTSISPDIWELIITDLMPEGLYKNLLMSSYVERKNEKKMTTDFELEEEALRSEIKKAEMALKNKLIRGDNYYYGELVLRDKTSRNVEVSEEFIKEFVKWQEEKSFASPLADVFGVNLDKEEINDKVVDFLYRFSEKLQWSDEDKLIWRLRFIESNAPVDVAERCGRARAWLDTRYSRLNKKFNAAIREWWKNNA